MAWACIDWLTSQSTSSRRGRSTRRRRTSSIGSQPVRRERAIVARGSIRGPDGWRTARRVRRRGHSRNAVSSHSPSEPARRGRAARRGWRRSPRGRWAAARGPAGRPLRRRRATPPRRQGRPREAAPSAASRRRAGTDTSRSSSRPPPGTAGRGSRPRRRRRRRPPRTRRRSGRGGRGRARASCGPASRGGRDPPAGTPTAPREHLDARQRGGHAAGPQACAQGGGQRGPVDAGEQRDRRAQPAASSKPRSSSDGHHEVAVVGRLHHRAEGADHVVALELGDAERGEGGHPVDRLGEAGRLVEVELADPHHERGGRRHERFAPAGTERRTISAARATPGKSIQW